MEKGRRPDREAPLSSAVGEASDYICGFLPGISLAGLPGQ